MDHAALIELRASDRKELSQWFPDGDQVTVLQASIKVSEKCFTVLSGDQVVAIGGYAVQDNKVTPWLVGSDLMAAHKATIVRACKQCLGHIKSCFSGYLIYNFVAKDNTKARRLLTSLGFDLLPTPGNGQFDFFHYPAN